jgi:hypothetical protein
MITESAHQENWLIYITREPGDDGWPDAMPVEFGRAGTVFRPEKIAVHLQRGSDRPSGSVQGPRLKIDGQPGLNHARNTFYGLPDDWLGEKVRKVREDLNLTPEVTGVGW